MIKESCKFSTPFRHKTIRLVIFRFLFISIMRQQYSINMYMILMIRFQLKIVNKDRLTGSSRSGNQYMRHFSKIRDNRLTKKIHAKRNG